MLQRKVLVSKLLAINGLPASAVVVCEVTALAHETRDDTMEDTVREAKARLTRAELTEIFCGLWHFVSAELHDHPSGCLASNAHVKEYTGFASSDAQCLIELLLLHACKESIKVSFSHIFLSKTLALLRRLIFILLALTVSPSLDALLVLVTPHSHGLGDPFALGVLEAGRHARHGSEGA